MRYNPAEDRNPFLGTGRNVSCWAPDGQPRSKSFHDTSPSPKPANPSRRGQRGRGAGGVESGEVAAPKFMHGGKPKRRGRGRGRR